MNYAVRNTQYAAVTPAAAWVSRVAFAIAVAIVLARCLMLEILRDPDVAGANAPGGPGAATSVALDWLCLVPVGLLLARRLLDATFTLRFTWAHGLAVALAAWTLASVGWADDRFAALVGAMNVCAGVALFWTISQLVRRWDHVRVVAGLAAGLLLANVAQAAIFRAVEFPALVDMWRANKDKILADNGWHAGDYSADRFEKKLLAGELLGFNASPNTLAAMCVMTGLAALGVAAQRRADRDDPGWTGVCGLIAASTLFPLLYTGSKGAGAALAIGVAMLGVWWPLRRWLASHRPLLFAAGCCAVALGVAAVIAYGLTTGGLPTDSLNFRWRYWVGAWPLVIEHPLRGVGWANFGSPYLAHRVPTAAEEIQDPHDLFVRWATELGLVGLALGVAWLVAWAWRAARPTRRSASAAIATTSADARDVAPLAYATAATTTLPVGDVAGGVIGVAPLLGVVALAYALNVACAVDFAVAGGDGFYYAFMELLKRGVLFAAVALGLAAVTLTTRRDERSGNGDITDFEKSVMSPFRPFRERRMEAAVGRHVDARPAPWVAAALFVGVAMLLLQSTIDLAFFEAGPMALAMTLMGALVGLGVDDGRPARRDSLTLVALIVGSIVAVVVLAAIVVPVGIAESFARQADDFAARQPARAIDLYERAAAWTPAANWTYPDRAARIAAGSGDPRAGALLDAIVAADRSRPLAYLNRARFNARAAKPPVDAIVADMAQAVARNPNDVNVRLEFADVLDHFGRSKEAADQLFAALAADDALDEKEPKRLSFRSPGMREQIQARAARLIGG